MMIDPPLPTFQNINDVLDKVKSSGKPISIILMGTIWSPPCRYTFQSLMEVMKDNEISKNVTAFYVNQDESHQFCYTENIPIGFPTLIIFAAPNTDLPDVLPSDPIFILHFVPKGQVFDQNKLDISKQRIVRQLNPKQIKEIIDEALLVYEGKRFAITIPE